ncbi:AMP-binding protein [Micromonospora sp. KC606]|uniref:AMP-binding protein n=1 Tax=Micromonospora sp. KC606 TaxID=2530379 RepID=UPI001A9F5076|nr:AMP-binding protein [Micromonospora sp. KC606]
MARIRPDATALIAGDRRVSYADLDRTAAAWSVDLTRHGVRPGHLVPIVLPRGVQLVVSLLAVLKAGAAYSLLDPGWPVSRLTQILGQLDSPVVVTVDLPPAGTGAGWRPPNGASAPPPDWLARPALDTDGCCVFFTSGTTGPPKGALSTHRAIARLFQGGVLPALTERAVVPIGAPTPWDAFALELWWALLTGGTALLDDEPYLTGVGLRRAVVGHGATVTWLTSTLFNMIVDEEPDSFAGLHAVVAGGEALSPRHVRRFLDHHPAIPLFNGYGPVESTVFTTLHRVRPADCDLPDGIPLGRPVPGTGVHVLRGDQPCPVGVVGEICVSGEGLALRYVGDPALTRRRFASVVVDGRDTRIYRTGDLGSLTSDGVLHFHGRADRQVKIRGHRVEPAEVERQIEALLPVRACRVVPVPAQDGRPDRLLAFCVPRRPEDPLDGALDVLRATIVPHQLPAAVQSVEAFPVTANGKLDEARLLVDAGGQHGPDHPVGKPSSDRPRSAPGIEQGSAALVATVFGEVLRAPVSPASSFHDLGGSSLDAGRICARLSTALRRPVPLSRLYRHPSVAALAGWLDRTSADEHQRRPVPPDAAVPLTAMQTVFLTRSLVDPADRTGHCLLTWTVQGRVDRAALAVAVSAVHHRHTSLRASYLPDPTPRTLLVEIDPPPVEELPGRATVEAAVAAVRDAFDEDLDVTVADLWRIALVPVGEDTTVLGIVVHHIAFDGRSQSVLATELGAAYHRALRRRDGDRPPIPLDVTYRHCPVETDEAVVAEVQRRLRGVPELVWPTLPARRPSGAPATGLVTAVIQAATVDALGRRAATLGTSPYVALLACHGWAVATVTGHGDFLVSSPVSQRTSAETVDAIGCHITMVFVRMRGEMVDGDPSAVRAVAAAVAAARAAQDVPLGRILDLAGPQRPARPPIAQTLFALQDDPVPRLDLTDTTTRFVRQPYLDLPADLHVELWPGKGGELSLDVSFRVDAVARETAEAIACRLVERVDALVRPTARGW